MSSVMISTTLGRGSGPRSAAGGVLASPLVTGASTARATSSSGIRTLVGTVRMPGSEVRWGQWGGRGQ